MLTRGHLLWRRQLVWRRQLAMMYGVKETTGEETAGVEETTGEETAGLAMMGGGEETAGMVEMAGVEEHLRSHLVRRPQNLLI
jgi:hypothetical protein